MYRNFPLLQQRVTGTVLYCGDPVSMKDQVGFMLHKVSLGEVSSSGLQLSPPSINSPIVYYHLRHFLSRRTNAQNLGKYKNRCHFGNRGSLNTQVLHTSPERVVSGSPLLKLNFTEILMIFPKWVIWSFDCRHTVCTMATSLCHLFVIYIIMLQAPQIIRL